jgi:hypothetical protein
MTHLQDPQSEGIKQRPEMSIVPVEFIQQLGDAIDQIEGYLRRQNHRYFQHKVIIPLYCRMLTTVYLLLLYLPHIHFDNREQLLTQHLLEHLRNSRSVEQVLSSMHQNTEIGIEQGHQQLPYQLFVGIVLRDHTLTPFEQHQTDSLPTSRRKPEILQFKHHLAKTLTDFALSVEQPRKFRVLLVISTLEYREDTLHSRNDEFLLTNFLVRQPFVEDSNPPYHEGLSQVDGTTSRPELVAVVHRFL